MVEPKLEYVVKPANPVEGTRTEVITSVKKIKDLSHRLKAIRQFIEQYLDQYNLVSVDFSLSKLAITNIEAKEQNQDIQTIKVMNEMISKKPSPLALLQVIEYLPIAPSLHTINFSGVSLSEQQVLLLAESLASSTSVKVMIIKQNNFNLNAARVISEMIRLNRTLIEFNLNGNNFCASAINWIAISLKVNKALMRVDIRNKESSLIRIKPMLKVFRLNSNLEELKFL